MQLRNPRQVAFDILRKVEAGGYASDLLLTQSAALDSRDAGLASEIVFGVLRYRAQLDYLVGHYSGRRGRLDPEVGIALRMGIFQLRYLERIPAHAAVSESVELVRRAKKSSAAGFVNAVLRKVDREPVPWPSREIELSCPAWLLARWERHYGAPAAEEIARAALREPEKYRRGGRMQDIGSQAIVPLLDPRPGQWFLDLCAAPGNKTAQALESGVRAIACDIHPHRLAGLKGLGADLVVLDGTRPLPFSRRFERILVDAPCSGTGTLGRNPEIKWKLRPEDLPNLQSRQMALLRNALAVLAPGGALVYATCSLEPEENEQVIDAVLSGPPAGDSWRVVEAGLRSDPEANAAAAPLTPDPAGHGEPPVPAGHGERTAEGARLPLDAHHGEQSERTAEDAPRPLTPPHEPSVPAGDRSLRRLPGRDPGDGFFAAVIESR